MYAEKSRRSKISELRSVDLQEVKCQQIFERAACGIVVYKVNYDAQGHPEEYIFEEVNPAFERLIQRSGPSILGKANADVLMEEDRDVLGKAYDTVLRKKESVQFDLYLKSVDRYCEVSVSFLASSHIVALFLDTTEKKKNAENARAAQSEVQALIESSPFGVVKYELKADGKLVVTGCNPAANRILKIDCSQNIGKTIEESFPGLVGTSIPSRYRSVAAEGRKYSGEQIIYKDSKISGAFDTHAFQTAPDQMIVFFRDITDQKVAENQLRQSEDKFYKSFQLSPNPLFISRFADGVYVDINAAFCEFTGYSRDDLIGHSSLPKDLSIWLSEGQRDEFIKELRSHGEIYKFEAALCGKDGEAHICHLSAKTAIISGELCIIGSALDITLQKREQDALIFAREAAERASKLKSEFLDIAAHELKTPLTPMTLLLERAEKNLSQGLPVPDVFFSHIARQIRRLTVLVDDLLDVSRLERGGITLRRADVDLTQIVHQTVNEFESRAPARLIVAQGADTPVQAHVDADKIHEILVNFLDNALKYTPENSPIEVKLSQEGSHVRISVVDHGGGISKKEQTGLFSKFIRLSADGTLRNPGLGLGLYFCRRIAELHGGSAGVKSEPGKGSTFYVDIPV